MLQMNKLSLRQVSDVPRVSRQVLGQGTDFHLEIRQEKKHQSCPEHSSLITMCLGPEKPCSRHALTVAHVSCTV